MQRVDVRLQFGGSEQAFGRRGRGRPARKHGERLVDKRDLYCDHGHPNRRIGDVFQHLLKEFYRLGLGKRREGSQGLDDDSRSPDG